MSCGRDAVWNAESDGSRECTPPWKWVWVSSFLTAH